jgi:hypothetical protein
VKRAIGQTPPMLRWIWTDGESPCGDVSCYRSASKKIEVLSSLADRDEYDDLVLLHEFGHFFQDLYSRDNSPGGNHSSRTRSAPTLAWSEGSATFFGCLAKGTPLYLDTLGVGAIGVRSDIETLPPEIPLGTSNNQQIGKVSEGLVRAIMWDLADASNEALDTITREPGVFAAMTYLHGAKFTDRGFAGADLVDFLDGWFCNGLDDRGDATKGVQANVVAHHKFNYDFAAVPSCR